MVQCWFYQCQLTITLNCSLSLQQGDSATHKDLSKCSDIHKMFVMSFCWTGDNRRVITVFTFICLYWAAIVVPTEFQFPVLCQLLKEGDYLEPLFNYLDEQNAGIFVLFFFLSLCLYVIMGKPGAWETFCSRNDHKGGLKIFCPWTSSVKAEAPQLCRLYSQNFTGV